VSRPRRPSLQHPLVPVFERAVASICTALSPASACYYNETVHDLLRYLVADYPEVNRLSQLRREPHILGWMSRIRSQKPPLATVTYIGRLIALRGVFNELAWSNKHSELARLIRREDIPRKPQRPPRPLTAEQDQLLQQEFLRRNDLGGNAFLLIRHTGMRIGECVDLASDCLRSTGPDQWAIHVPLGKLKTERMVPVDASMCELVQRLRFFRSLDPLSADGRLLARTSSKHALVRRLRDYLHEVCYSLNLSIRIVPHQFRHSYATEMLRAGVSFPVLMKLLGHTQSRDDHAICRCRVDRSSTRIPPSSGPPKVSGSAAKGVIHPSSSRPRWRHRILARRSTCAGDVPPSTAKWPFSHLPRPALQPSREDPQRGA
jgi:integrase